MCNQQCVLLHNIEYLRLFSTSTSDAANKAVRIPYKVNRYLIEEYKFTSYIIVLSHKRV